MNDGRLVERLPVKGGINFLRAFISHMGALARSTAESVSKKLMSGVCWRDETGGKRRPNDPKLLAPSDTHIREARDSRDVSFVASTFQLFLSGIFLVWEKWRRGQTKLTSERSVYTVMFFVIDLC